MNDVRLYTAPMDGQNHLVKSGYYEPCQLLGETTTDEDGIRLLYILTNLAGKSSNAEAVMMATTIHTLSTMTSGNCASSSRPNIKMTSIRQYMAMNIVMITGAM